MVRNFPILFSFVALEMMNLDDYHANSQNVLELANANSQNVHELAKLNFLWNQF